MSKSFLICVAAASLAVFIGLYGYLCYSMWVLLVDRFTPIQGPEDLICLFLSTLFALLVLFVGAIQASGIMFGPEVGGSAKSVKSEHKNR
jgi:hypothetical protein